MASVALSAKAVGSTVKLKVGGTARNFIVVHKGKPSAAYDASCDGVSTTAILTVHMNVGAMRTGTA